MTDDKFQPSSREMSRHVAVLIANVLADEGPAEAQFIAGLVETFRRLRDRADNEDAVMSMGKAMTS